MRAVVTRVTAASVVVDGATVGELPGPGLLVLLGVTHTDDDATAARMATKISGLRILRAPLDPTPQASDPALSAPEVPTPEVSAAEIGAPMLVVSQFTLYGDTRRGRRPSWSEAAPASHAEPLVDAVVAALRAAGITVATGIFGAQMTVTSVNDGPFTLILEI
jgi:D-tyrosyl-tRNA(Tyr) deacylase